MALPLRLIVLIFIGPVVTTNGLMPIRITLWPVFSIDILTAPAYAETIHVPTPNDKSFIGSPLFTLPCAATDDTSEVPITSKLLLTFVKLLFRFKFVVSHDFVISNILHLSYNVGRDKK